MSSHPRTKKPFRRGRPFAAGMVECSHEYAQAQTAHLNALCRVWRDRKCDSHPVVRSWSSTGWGDFPRLGSGGWPSDRVNWYDLRQSQEEWLKFQIRTLPRVTSLIFNHCPYPLRIWRPRQKAYSLPRRRFSLHNYQLYFDKVWCDCAKPRQPEIGQSPTLPFAAFIFDRNPAAANPNIAGHDCDERSPSHPQQKTERHVKPKSAARHSIAPW